MYVSYKMQLTEKHTCRAIFKFSIFLHVLGGKEINSTKGLLGNLLLHYRPADIEYQMITF